MEYVIVNIGSNLGERRLNLSRAVRAIASVFGDFEVSHTVETAPSGFVSDKKFLNICMMFRTDMKPDELLLTLLRIEKEICPDSHRDADGRYVDRVIDIDILAIGARTVDTETLKVPHPRLAERLFYLMPMNEIAGAWRHPVTGLTPAEMIISLPSEND